ncbi:hypothetical protein GDO86_008663 [Hymenochirus boettgeri]|uniref:Fucosyltransferase n=1 Tax=Hymenochirus boettgeri TaxID=247094 RepID=A0A8T2J5Y1_9PIPI|nr:hypothetical protein GDO86_008663 [Hymenochirus boettgeri]
MDSFKKMSKIVFLVLIFQGIFGFIFYISLKNNKTNIYKPILPITINKMKSNRSALTILVWTWPFDIHLPLMKCSRFLRDSSCIFTDDRNLYSSADAVILHHREVYKSKHLLPQLPRPSEQYWIWFNMESPQNSPNLQLMDNLINLTMTYKVDSDIFTPYGFLKQRTETDPFTVPIKTKLVAWVISNWKANNYRIQYYNELKKYINIDLYGKYHTELPSGKHNKIISMYKFYMAFENSVHQDYITEKLWNNAFMSMAVPIVMGPPRSNYERFIPSNSFIHVNDFSTPKELADYLYKLDQDDNKYQQYFKWRSKYQPIVNTDFFKLYCNVCKALKNAPARRFITSISDWYK